MFFKPDTAKKFVQHLREQDEGRAFLAAYDLCNDEELVKTAVLPVVEYNDEVLADLIEADLALMLTACVHDCYGQIVPRILGLALDYMERKVLESSEEDDGETGSESVEQGNDEEVAG